MSEALQHEVELNKEATKPEDKVPLNQKVAYAMGVVSDHYANVCISLFMTAFFVDFMKIGAAIVGYAMGTARCWDAFTDPVVGMLSDRSKSKRGRRKPFVFVGAVLTGLFFPVIWMVPEGWTAAAITIYLFGALLVYYTFYSIFSVPYEALGAELTPDYKERNSVFVVRTYVQQVFNLGIIWIFPFAMWLATKSWIGGEINGVRSVSWLIGAMIIFSGVIPAIGCVERYRKIAEKQEKAEFWAGVKSLLTNKPYLIIIGTICTYLFTIMATMNLAYFVNVYYIYEGQIQAGAVLGGIDGTLRFFFSLGAAWSIKKLTDKYDKHHMMMACVSLLLVTFIGIYFTTIPGRPWLTLVMKPFLAIGEVGFWVLVLSMRADVCDYDEHRTGKRNEGLIAATMNWMNKMAITLAMILSGLLLQNVVKFDSNLNEQVNTLVTIEEQTSIKGKISVEKTLAYEAFSAIEKEDGGAVLIERLVEKMEQLTVGEEKENVVFQGALYKTLLAAYPKDEEAEKMGLFARIRAFFSDDKKDGLTVEHLAWLLKQEAIVVAQVDLKSKIAAKADAAYEALPTEQKEGEKAVTVESLINSMEDQAMKVAEEQIAMKVEADYRALSDAEKASTTLEGIKEKVEKETKINLKAWIAVDALAAYEALPAEKKEGKDAITLERLTKSMEQKAVMEKQSPGTMQRLRKVYTFPQVGALILCLIMLSRYKLSHKKLAEVRKELEDRRGETIHG